MRKLDADTENEINKIRWERWRAKQKTEREKTCFYCWDNWGEVSYHCGNSRGCPHGCADVGVELSYDVENCSVHMMLQVFAFKGAMTIFTVEIHSTGVFLEKSSQ